MITEQYLISKYNNKNQKIPTIWKNEMYMAMNLQTDLINYNYKVVNPVLIEIINDLKHYNTTFFSNCVSETGSINEPLCKKQEQRSIDDKLDKLINY